MTEFCNFKIDVIKWELDFVLHKFSLNHTCGFKSNLH